MPRGRSIVSASRDDTAIDPLPGCIDIFHDGDVVEAGVIFHHLEVVADVVGVVKQNIAPGKKRKLEFGYLESWSYS